MQLALHDIYCQSMLHVHLFIHSFVITLLNVHLESARRRKGLQNENMASQCYQRQVGVYEAGTIGGKKNKSSNVVHAPS